jgi:hypothetical protein
MQIIETLEGEPLTKGEEFKSVIMTVVPDPLIAIDGLRSAGQQTLEGLRVQVPTRHGITTALTAEIAGRALNTSLLLQEGRTRVGQAVTFLAGKLDALLPGA